MRLLRYFHVYKDELRMEPFLLKRVWLSRELLREMPPPPSLQRTHGRHQLPHTNVRAPSTGIKVQHVVSSVFQEDLSPILPQYNNVNEFTTVKQFIHVDYITNMFWRKLM